jgi:HemY protein
MLRIFLFFGVLLALAFGLSWLADQPGTFALSFGAKIYEVSLLVGGLGLIAVCLTLMFLLALLRFILRLPSLVSLSNHMRRRSKGLAAVSHGMVAVGSGDARSAEQYASQAMRLLGHEPLTLLLKAQSAQLAGKREDAEATFTKMLETSETRVLGLRGLFVEARRRGDVSGARQYAENAHKIAPNIAWASQSALEYASLDGDWAQALKVVDQNTSRNVSSKPESRRQRAVLLCAKALDLAESAPEIALKCATDALKLEPSLVPAAVLAGKYLSSKGNYNRASKIIESAWKEMPHPALSEVYIDIRKGDSALDRLKRATYLAKVLPDNRESRFIVAKAALQAKEFKVVRENLELLVLEKPTVRACLLMAELEDKEFNRAGASREWLSRAAHAPRDPIWVADGHVSETWKPISPITGHLDAYTWCEPPQAIEASLRATLDANSIHFNAEESAETIQKATALIENNSVAALEKAGAIRLSDKPQPIIFAVSHAPDDPGLK